MEEVQKGSAVCHTDHTSERIVFAFKPRKVISLKSYNNCIKDQDRASSAFFHLPPSRREQVFTEHVMKSLSVQSARKL